MGEKAAYHFHEKIFFHEFDFTEKRVAWIITTTFAMIVSITFPSLFDTQVIEMYKM